MSAQRRLDLSIAGAHITARVPAPSTLSLTLKGAARQFRRPPAPADIAFTVARAALAAPPASRQSLFRSGALWELYRDLDGPGFQLDFRSSAMGPAPYRRARFSDDFSRGELLLNDDCPLYADRHLAHDPFEYPFDELVLSNWLARGRGIELHSCGLVDQDGQGYLFVGVSGAGKSTVARLWERESPAAVLSDDRIVVRPGPQGLQLHGTPWHGEAHLCLPRAAPLRAVFLLRQGQGCTPRPLPSSEVVARLVACAFFPFYDRAAIDWTLSFAARLATTVPCFELEFDLGVGLPAVVRAVAR